METQRLTFIKRPNRTLKLYKKAEQIHNYRVATLHPATDGAPAPAPPIPIPVLRALAKLGGDLSLARRRRRFTQASLAQRIGASLATVRRMEQGDPRIPLHFLARALMVFNELDRLSQLLDSSADVIGLTLMDEKLPQRIRQRKATASPGSL